MVLFSLLSDARISSLTPWVGITGFDGGLSHIYKGHYITCSATVDSISSSAFKINHNDVAESIWKQNKWLGRRCCDQLLLSNCARSPRCAIKNNSEMYASIKNISSGLSIKFFYSVFNISILRLWIYNLHFSHPIHQYLTIHSPIDQFFNNGRLGERRSIAEWVIIVSSDFSQNSAHNLSRARFRKSRHPLN